MDPAALSNVEIDELVRDSVGAGGSLYAVDSELVDRLAPDLIVTQDLCAVCAVSSEDLSTACPLDTEILSLDPRTLQGVSDSVLALARRLDVEDRGLEIVEEMWGKIRAVERAVAGARRPLVFFAEWIEPPYCGGHWIPEMIERAGGTCLFGSVGEPSYRVSWRDVLELEPELVVIAPCGFHVEEAAARAGALRLPRRAVAVDADSLYSRPAPRLADGVCQLGHLLHPDAVPDAGWPAIELKP
jgi:iron complex transport system substrate-binding protein